VSVDVEEEKEDEEEESHQPRAEYDSHASGVAGNEEVDKSE